jgi:hypothetical protein
MEIIKKIIRTALEKYAEKTKSSINSKEYLEASKEAAEDFTRSRKMPFSKLIQFMLTRTKGSTQNALEKFFDKLGEDVFMTQQAFSEARNKLKVSAFSELFYMTAGLAYEGYYDTYRGYRLLAIDGSKIALPDIELLGRIYGAMGADSSSPTAQASICYDVLNKVIADAQIAPLTTSERTLALSHIGNLGKSRRFDKELALMDRGYASYDFISELLEENISFLMRVKRGFNKDIDAQTKADGIVILRKKGRADIKLRVIKFTLPSGETEILITNLFKKNMGVEDFKELYFLRWPVETKYDEIKNKLEIENFTGNSKKAIEQDFYAAMYLSNIAAAARWEAQARVEKDRERKNNKYEYKVNVNHEIGVLKDRFIYALTLDDSADEIEKIIFLLAKRVCPLKPDRSVKRNKSPRKSKFHLNLRSNC